MWLEFDFSFYFQEKGRDGSAKEVSSILYFLAGNAFKTKKTLSIFWWNAWVDVLKSCVTLVFLSLLTNL